ncbi:MAG: hypothetical protein IJ629_03135 [Clostridia bacterium]|nr:hypothetical protein [Clostridia bacterium]
MLAALVVGIAFAVVLPNTSKDVFFYMGNGRAIDKYHINPYTTSVSEVETLDTTDSLLKTVGSQKDYVFVYGPIFLTICGLLNKISFSSVVLFLYEFKLLNLIAYLITTYLIFRLTKKKKLAIAFAFNPLVLLEVLVNVHNDIFVVLFALFGILFVKESEKVRGQFVKSEVMFLCGLIFFAISACIKYIAIILVPFVILYRLREVKWIHKILVGMAYLLVFFGIFFGMYLPYFENPFMAFSGAFAQSGKLKDSIYLIIAMITEQDSQIVSICYSIGFFVLIYQLIIKLLMQCFRKNNFRAMMENSYSVLFALIFLGLTNLTSWYLLWLFIPVFWTNGRKLKNFMWIGFLYEVSYAMFYAVHDDITNLQVWILPWIGIGMIVRQVLLKLREEI